MVWRPQFPIPDFLASPFSTSKLVIRLPLFMTGVSQTTGHFSWRVEDQEHQRTKEFVPYAFNCQWRGPLLRASLNSSGLEAWHSSSDFSRATQTCSLQIWPPSHYSSANLSSRLPPCHIQIPIFFNNTFAFRFMKSEFLGRGYDIKESE